MSLLEKGTYTITSKVDGAPVGRFISQDENLLPTPLFVLPRGVPSPIVFFSLVYVERHVDDEIPQFTIERHKAGYRIEAAGAITGIHNKYVSAFFGTEEPEDWIITPQPRSGTGVYT